MLFSERLKKIRLACGLTQEEVAKALGIERTTYTYYESGRHEPSLVRTQDIARLFNTDIATLLGENDIGSGAYMLSDDAVDYGAELDKFNELRKDEAMLLLYYRRLDAGKKAKIMKSIREKFDK